MRLHLVQSQRQVEELARQGQSAITLRALVLELAELAAPERPRAGPEATRLIAESIATQPSLAELIDSGLGVLRQCGVTARELSVLPDARARLFLDALAAADAELARAGLRDERGDGWLAASAVADTTLPDVSEIVVLGGARLGAAELQLLERLHLVLRTRGGSVTLRFPSVIGESSRRSLERELGRLEARWAEHNDAPTLIRDDETSHAKLDARLTRAPSAVSEARAVVRAVQEHLSRGANLDRIAIVPLELSEAFLEELRSALWAAKLPFSEPRGRPPVAGPNVHATLELLRLVGGPVRRDALLDVLAAPGLRTTRWFGEGGRAALNVLRELLARTPVGFDHDGRLLLARTRSLAEARSDAVTHAALAGLERALGDLRDLRTPRSRSALARDFAALIEDLGLLQVRPRTLSLALAQSDAGGSALLTALADDARGSAALSLALERLVRAAERLGQAEAPVTPYLLSAELLRALSGVGQSRGAARAAAIAIARPSEVAGLSLDLAVICRASAAAFSRLSGSAGSLWLGSALCEALPRDKRPPSARDEEAATFTALGALLVSAQAVEVVWSTSDGSSETRESRFVEELAAAGPFERRDEPGSPLSAGARRIVAIPEPRGELELRARRELERQAFFFGQGVSSELNGSVSGLSAWLGQGVAPLPVTRLERYVDCPFLGFASIVLRATRDEAVGDALGARERGTLIHAAVAEALSTIAGLDRPDAELLELALAAADRALERHRGSVLRGAALRAARSDVQSFVRWSLEHRQYAFRSAEKGFGDGESWGPLELGPYRLSGRVDRIDVSSDGQRARIIDYKSGKPPSRSDERALQGWLYARKVGSELGVAEVESMYLGLTRRMPQRVEIFTGPLDAPELAEREQFALAKLVKLEAGHVAAEPTRPSRCARCDARELCRRPLSAPAPEDAGDEP